MGGWGDVVVQRSACVRHSLDGAAVSGLLASQGSLRLFKVQVASCIVHSAAHADDKASDAKCYHHLPD
jgi:hypothetical protein